MATSLNNYFNIDNAKDWYCKLYTIAEGSTMKLQLLKSYDDKDRLWINFKSVGYFEGSVGWQGALFEQGSEEELMILARSIRKLQSLSNEEILEKYQLFVVSIEGSSERIRIIAEEANLTSTFL